MDMLNRQAILQSLLQEEGESEFEFNTAIQKLRAFSLITQETEVSILSMHRLVQLSIQKWLELEQAIQKWQEKPLALIYKSCPSTGFYENWAAWEAINPHVQAVLGYDFEMDSCLEQRAGFLGREAEYLGDKGRFEAAHSKAMEASAIREMILGQDHLLTLDTVHILGTRKLRPCFCEYLLSTRRRMA